MSAAAIGKPEVGLEGLTRLRLAGPLTAATAPQFRARVRNVV